MFVANVIYQGNIAKDRSPGKFILSAANYADASTELGLILAALANVTKAVIKKVSLSEVVSEDGSLPADQSADTFEVAQVSTYLNIPANAEKLHTISIPAPVGALFLTDGSTLDTTNAALIAYIDALSQYTEVSDGETIVTTTTNGIKSGYKITKARSFK